MAKNKNNQAIWSTRIKKNGSNLFQKVGNSIDIDKRLYKEDILGSIAHVEMLFKQKIISFKVKNKIIYGLNKINKEIEYNKFKFEKKYEDIHMNIEKRLFKIIGEDAGYVHTARSRNDQVITDFKIWIKTASKEIEINKYDFLEYNENDFINELTKLAHNINMDLETLKKICNSNELNFLIVENQMKTELLWNSLIFYLYKNRISINLNEIDEQLKLSQKQ